MVYRNDVIGIFTAEVNIILLYSCKKTSAVIGKLLADGAAVRGRTRRIIYRNFGGEAGNLLRMVEEDAGFAESLANRSQGA